MLKETKMETSEMVFEVGELVRVAPGGATQGQEGEVLAILDDGRIHVLITSPGKYEGRKYPYSPAALQSLRDAELDEVILEIQAERAEDAVLQGQAQDEIKVLVGNAYEVAEDNAALIQHTSTAIGGLVSALKGNPWLRNQHIDMLKAVESLEASAAVTEAPVQRTGVRYRVACWYKGDVGKVLPVRAEPGYVFWQQSGKDGGGVGEGPGGIMRNLPGRDFRPISVPVSDLSYVNPNGGDPNASK